MQLEELTKHPNDMSKEELDSYISSLLDSIEDEVEELDIKFERKYGSSPRKTN